MGSLTKALGRLSARALESESARIHRTSRANKVPGSLSVLLDRTLKDGHDMKVFGLGTAASMASRERYTRFTSSMLHVYTAMESELDASAAAGGVAGLVWGPHGAILRRGAALRQDLADVGILVPDPLLDASMTPFTREYVQSIREAGDADRRSGGGRLLGHLYCRYLADLFGGQMLKMPYKAALGLERSPAHYDFKFQESRREYINSVYERLNEAGDAMSAEQRDACYEEAMVAFKHNIKVYSEEPMVVDAGRGVFNIVTGFATTYART